MSENVGSIVYEVDANTSGLVAASKQVEAANKKLQKSFNDNDKAATGMQKGYGGAAWASKQLTKEIEGTTSGGKKLGNSMRQASMQLSQVAQQGSVTGNYLQALAIQLPDLALGFGTVGIIAGALAGTVGIGLLNAFTGADKSIDDLEETLKTLGSTFQTVAGESNQLAESLRQLQAVSKSAVELRVAVQTQEAEEAIKKAGEFIFESLADGLSTNTILPIFGLEKILAVGSSASVALEGVAREAKITTEEMTALMGSHSLIDHTGCTRTNGTECNPNTEACTDLRMFKWSNVYYRDACSPNIRINNPPVRSTLPLNTLNNLRTINKCKFTSPELRQRQLDLFDTEIRINPISYGVRDIIREWEIENDKNLNREGPVIVLKLTGPVNKPTIIGLD